MRAVVLRLLSSLVAALFSSLSKQRAYAGSPTYGPGAPSHSILNIQQHTTDMRQTQRVRPGARQTLPASASVGILHRLEQAAASASTVLHVQQVTYIPMIYSASWQ